MKKALLVSAIISTLTACGSSGDSPTSINNYQSVKITSSNSEEVASTSAAIVFDSLASEFADIVTAVKQSKKVNYQNFVNTKNIIPLIQTAYDQQSEDFVSGIKRSDKLDCAVSGTMDIEASIASAFKVSKGDYITTTMHNCNQGFGTSSGLMTVTFLSDSSQNFFIGSGDFNVKMQISLDQFTMSEKGTNAVANGELILELSQQSQGYSSKMTTNQFSVTSIDSGIEQVLADFTTATNLNFNTTISTMSTSGDVADSTLKGKIHLDTVTTFNLFENQSINPYSGKLKITGENSILWLTAQSDSSVLIELDTNADGTVDSSETISWSELY